MLASSNSVVFDVVTADSSPLTTIIDLELRGLYLHYGVGIGLVSVTFRIDLLHFVLIVSSIATSCAA